MWGKITNWDKDLGQYFIAVVPPSPIYEYAYKLKEYFRDQYKSKASLNSPPHITLHMPFRWKESRENKLIESLTEFFTGYPRFQLELKNFSGFPPRVIFLDVGVCPQLCTLQAELRKYCRQNFNVHNADYKDQPFHPHLTLAFRDLKKPAYAQAWNEFSGKTYNAEFIVEHIVLLKHTGKFWKELHRFAL